MRLFLRLLPLLLLLPTLPAQAVEVLASIRPLALIATAVMQGQGTPAQLVPDGVSSHDYSLRPSDRVELAKANVVLWIGPAHELFLTRALSGTPALVLTVQNLPGITLRPQRDMESGQPVVHTVDGHIWLSPANAVVIAQALAEALARREPEHAAAFRANEQAFARQMQVLGAHLGSLLAAQPARRYIAYHDAYQYLEPSLGLQFSGALTLGHEQAPGARHLSILAARVPQEGIGCLLAEPGFDAALARRTFDGSKAHFVSVDELFTQAPRDASGYGVGLQQMADGVRQCLQP